MKQARYLLLAVLLISSMLFAGCTYNPDRNGIQIKSDGRVVSAEVASISNDGFDTPRYDEEGLKASVEEDVLAYNKKTANLSYTDKSDADGLPASIEKFKVKGDEAKVVLEFSSATHYLDFYGVTEASYVKDLVVGTVGDGINSGVSFENMLDSSGEAAISVDIKENTGYRLVKIYGEIDVEVDGRIVYYSKTMTKVSNDTVTASGTGTEYIVFK